MKSTPHLVSLVILAAAVSTPLLAGDRDHKSKRDRTHAATKRAASGFDYGMQAVSHDAARDAPGYGWRYFTDPSVPRAVVISPQGDYYYSHGKGLHWIAAEQT